jgi:hypothetical protein
MMPQDVDIDERAAHALELTSLDREDVARRLAQIGQLREPTRPETQALLVDVLISALRQIPSSNAAWSWGEFHNGGLQPLYDMSPEDEWPREALVAVDLGLGEHPASTQPGEVLSPRLALARQLTKATEQLLAAIRERLEAAGVSSNRPTSPPSS